MRDTIEIRTMFDPRGETQNYYRLNVTSKAPEIKGTLYIPKGEEIPDRVILERKQD